MRGASILPEFLKWPWCQLGVTDGVMDVAVAQIILNPPQIEPLIGKVVSAGMAQLVGMDREVETRLDSQATDQLADGMVSEW